MALATDPTSISAILLIDGKDRIDYADRIEAKDGRTGLDLYKSKSVDCIFTELYLPNMSKFELLVEVVPYAIAPGFAELRRKSNSLNSKA